MFKKLRIKLASWKLGRDLKAGRAQRGRVTIAPKRTIHTYWEEFKLRLRTIGKTAEFCLGPMTGGGVFPTGRLFAKHLRPDGSVVDYGLISTKLVTDAGVAFIVDAFQNITEIENLKFHASGTGGTAEAAGQTALVTEVATRTSGTTVEGASANIYRTVGTVTYAAPFAITEHGVFSASSVGTLLDRSLFAAINVINGDSIQFTYELTLPSGG